MDIINHPSVAVLIDCWDLPNQRGEPLHKRILSFIENTPAIKTIILASYDCHAEQETSSSIWYQNYDSWFVKNLKSQELRDLLDQHRKDEIIYRSVKTDPVVLNYVHPDIFQIAMKWPCELEYYLSNISADIENIYIFGSAWSICVRNRPLGYESLSKLPNVNILTNTNCVIDMGLVAVDLSNDPNWDKVDGDTYRLKNTFTIEE